MPRLLPALVALALSSSACGAESISSEDVAESTRGVGTARIETSMRFESGGQTFESRSSAVVDYLNDRSATVVEDTGCRTISIGSVTYAEMPTDAGLPPGKHWLRVDPPTESSEQFFEESLQQSPSEPGWTSYGIVRLFVDEERTPTDYLDYLRTVSGELAAVGEELVRGVPTTRYRTTIDTKRRTRQSLKAEGWKPGNIERYLETLVSTTEEVDVWVDADGRVRKVVTSYVPSQMAPSRQTTTTEYLDFGLDVDIDAPPVEGVLDEEEWEAIVGGRMREDSEGAEGARVEESVLVPDTFEPTEPVAPTSCLH